jgi:putative ABC transport system ATP-binding protein
MWRAGPLTEPHRHEPRNHQPRECAAAMLELRDLVKHYPTFGGEPVRAVDGVSLTVRAGEMVALYGPSGSGKTTLLLMIATLLEPTSGAVLIGGREASSLSEREASRFRLTELGFIRQSFDLLPGVSTTDNAILKLLGAMRWRQAQHEIEPLLVRLGLGERLRHHSETLSMGERQRVMIARALSTNPRLLLADEPTGSLDTQRGREVLELLRELCRERGVAVVLVSHDPMAARYADRVLALRDGRLGDYDADHEDGGRLDGSPGAPELGHAGASAATFTAAGTVEGTGSPPASVTRP